jgi:hypothetical protein
MLRSSIEKSGLRFTMFVPAFINHGSTFGAIVGVIIIQGVRP